MANFNDQRGIKFSVGTRVRVIDSGGIQTPIGYIGAKTPAAGLGIVGRVESVFSSDQQGLWAQLPADQQIIMYTITDERTGQIVSANFMNGDLAQA